MALPLSLGQQAATKSPSRRNFPTTACASPSFNDHDKQLIDQVCTHHVMLGFVSSHTNPVLLSPPDARLVIEMAAPAIQEELAARLRPYEAVLGRRAAMRRYGSHLWLCGSHSGDVDEDQALMEALELFALLARVDWRVWMDMVATVRTRSTFDGVQLDEDAPEQVGVSLTCTTRSRDLCEFLVTSSQNTTSSAAFQASKKLILRACADQGKPVDEVPMRFGLHYYESSEAQLAHMGQLVSRQQQACRDARRAADERGITTKPFYRGLRVREVDIGWIDVHADVALLRHAGEIVSCGISLSSLSPTLTEVLEQHPHEFMNAMLKIFPDGDPSEAETAGGVSCLTMRHFFSTNAYPAFLSAVPISSGVQKIDFAPYFNRAAATAEVRRWLWSWLAYGAFSKLDGQHNVQEISLEVGGLDTAIIENITRILQGTNPVATLFDREESDGAQATVSASQFALLDPSSAGGSSVAKWICDHPLRDLPVIERTNDWVSVLLPRWGQAWVHRDDVLSSQTKVVTAPQIQSIPRVTLVALREASRESVVALLQMVGQGIRHLVVCSRDDVDWRSFLREIFTACPVLESLQLNGDKGKLATLHCILDAFASGSCRLQQLHLNYTMLTGGCRSLPPLMEALSSPQHPASRYLKEITLSYMPFSTMLKPSAVPACVAMLKENAILQRFHMRFRGQHKHRAPFAHLLAQLKPFDGERIGGMRTRRTILAFLSVIVAGYGQDEPPRAIQQLDAQVVSVIVAFAAPPFIRRVTAN